MTRRILIGLLLVALAAAVIFGIVRGYEAWRSHVYAEGDRAGAARVQKLWDDERAAALAQANEDARRSAKETERRLRAQEEAQHAHQEELALARAAASRADAAAAGLREQVDRLAAAARAARGGTCDPAAVGDGTPAGDPIGVLADVLRRADERAGILARFADESRAAGLECERQYDALTPNPSNPNRP